MPKEFYVLELHHMAKSMWTPKQCAHMSLAASTTPRDILAVGIFSHSPTGALVSSVLMLGDKVWLATGAKVEPYGSGWG